uniref:Nanos-type domain-containing protein n=1 Tax=Ascaris lumbricoides TaxID=6252 RepID=A0A9J2PJJ8_ASCLU
MRSHLPLLVHRQVQALALFVYCRAVKRLFSKSWLKCCRCWMMSIAGRGTPIPTLDSGVVDSTPYPQPQDSSERLATSDAQGLLRSNVQLQYANMPQPVMLPGGHYYIVQPVPQFQKNGVTYYGAAAIEKQRTHLFVDSIRQHYLSMNGPLASEADVPYVNATSTPHNSASQNDLLMEQTPYVAGAVIQPCVPSSQPPVITQQQNPQSGMQQSLPSYQSCYAYTSSLGQLTPQQAPFFYSQPQTPSPPADEQAPFTFVPVQTNEQYGSVLPSRSYSQPAACMPSASLQAKIPSSSTGVVPINCCSNTVPPGFKTHLTTTEAAAPVNDVAFFQSAGVPMGGPPSTKMASASVPTTPTPYNQPCAPLPGSVVLEDGRVVCLQQPSLQTRMPFCSTPTQSFVQGPLFAPNNHILQPVGGITNQQFIPQAQNNFVPRLPVAATPLVVQNTPRPLMNFARRHNLISLTATPPSYNPTSRARKKPIAVLPYTGISRKEEESENENMPHNATSKKEWGEPPANIDAHEEHMDKSEKEDIITESLHQKSKPVNGNGVVNPLATTNADISHLPEHKAFEQNGNDGRHTLKQQQGSPEANKAIVVNEPAMEESGGSGESKATVDVKDDEGITPVQTMSISNEDYAEEGCSPPSAQRVAGHSAPLECAFCKSKKEPPEVYKSHCLRNAKTGVTTCPKLRQFVCALCMATGDKAHTPFFCPLNKYRGRGRSSNDVRASMRVANPGGPSWVQPRGRGVAPQARWDMRAFADAMAERSANGGHVSYDRSIPSTSRLRDGYIFSARCSTNEEEERQALRHDDSPHSHRKETPFQHESNDMGRIQFYFACVFEVFYHCLL